MFVEYVVSLRVATPTSLLNSFTYPLIHHIVIRYIQVRQHVVLVKGLENRSHVAAQLVRRGCVSWHVEH